MVEADTKQFNVSFTRTLINDVIAGHERVHAHDTPAHRRDLVRAVSAAIEGLHWQLKQDVLIHPDTELSIHEKAAMSEETYAVDDRGNVSVSPRFLPLANAIRLVVQMVRRYRPQYTVDFGHIGWNNLKSAIEVRNRLVHPKTIADLSVSDEDLEVTMSGFYWILALVIEVLEETNKSLEETRDAVRELIGKNPQ